MTKTQVEVITSVQRLRGWSRSEKEQIVATALEPGAVACEVARAAGLRSSSIRPGRTLHLLSCHRSVGSLLPAVPARSFAKLRSRSVPYSSHVTPSTPAAVSRLSQE